MDETGTINTLFQLTINLVSVACGTQSGRGDKVNMPDLEAAVAEASKTIELQPMGIAEYTVWYFELISSFSTCIEVDNDDDIVKATSSPERNWEQILCIVFPTSASNWPDRFAQVWIPVMYCVALIICFLLW